MYAVVVLLYSAYNKVKKEYVLNTHMITKWAIRNHDSY